MKRLKQVFNNNEIFHIFASQSQDTGRNSARNIYFENNLIFSYGSHYVMGAIYDSTILINNDSYSPTTAKHRSWLTNATSHMTSFFVPCPDDPKSTSNLEHLEENIVNAFDNMIKSIKPDRWMSSDITNQINIYEKYCKTFKIKNTLKIPDSFFDLIIEISQYKIARYNRPELKLRRDMRAKKLEADRLAKKQKRIKSDLFRIKDWKRGKINHVNAFNTSVFLRIKDDTVETSQGASVPLSHAIKLLYKIDQKIKADGDRIGFYKVDHVNDVKVTIGCHLIYFKEAYRTLGHVLKVYKKAIELVDSNLMSCGQVCELAFNMGIELTSDELVAINKVLI